MTVESGLEWMRMCWVPLHWKHGEKDPHRQIMHLLQPPLISYRHDAILFLATRISSFFGIWCCGSGWKAKITRLVCFNWSIGRLTGKCSSLNPRYAWASHFSYGHHGALQVIIHYYRAFRRTDSILICHGRVKGMGLPRNMPHHSWLNSTYLCTTLSPGWLPVENS